MIRSINWARFVLVAVAVVASVESVIAQPTMTCASYDPEHYEYTTPITMIKGAHPIHVGDTLPINNTYFDDIDYMDGFDGHDEEYIHDNVRITKVWICKPCGQFVTLDPNDPNGGLSSWVADQPGTYRVLVTVDDSGDPVCCPDDPAEFELTFTALDDTDCPSCQAPDARPFTPRANAAFDLEGIFLQFRLGTRADGESAGALELRAKQPSAALAQPSALRYGLTADDIDVYYDANDPNTVRQVRTPLLLADVVTLQTGSCYAIRLYGNDEIGEEQLDGFFDQTGLTPFKEWYVKNPTGDPNDCDVFTVTEYVYVNDVQTLRMGYVYAGTVGSEDWELRHVEDPNAATLEVLQTESVEWNLADPNNPIRTYSVTDASAAEIYHEVQDCRRIVWYGAGGVEAYRYPVERRVYPDVAGDPNDALVTTWTYNTSNGLNLLSEQRPDKSWTYYSTDLGDLNYPTNPAATIIEISGARDTSYSANPNPNSSGVRAVTVQYDHVDCSDGVTAIVPASSVEQLDGVIIGASNYTYTVDTTENRIATRTETQCPGADCSVGPLTTVGFWSDVPERVDYVDYPDGRRDDYDYDDVIAFTPSPTPATAAATWDPNVPVGSATGHHCRALVRFSPGLQLVNNKSTREVVILDPAGLPVFEASWVYVSGWQSVGWTNRFYDSQGRLTDTYRHDGTHEQIAYTSCCSRTVTDSTGVVTTYEVDLLGRIASVTRSVPDHGTTYRQPSTTTMYDYDTPLQTSVTVTVTGGGLAQTTLREYDAARRLTAVTTNVGPTGALKTLYEYGTTNEGGQTVTVYRDYPANAEAGEENVRDQVTAYYRDGHIKSVSGTLVTPRSYTYAAGSYATIVKEVVGTATDPNAPYTQTTYDMLGRVQAVTRPGWSGDPNDVLTTTYTYDDTGETHTGRLLSVAAPGQATTLYAYDDDTGAVLQTASDINGNGLIDLAGPDRVTESATTYELDEGAYWQVSRAGVYATDSSETLTPTGAQWTRLTGFASGVIRERRSEDAHDNQTITTTTLDCDHALLTESTVYPGSNEPEVSIIHGGRLMEAVSRSNVCTKYEYDGLGRRTKVTDGRGLETETHYDAAGRVSYTLDGADQQTDYGYYASNATGEGVYPGRLWYVENPLGTPGERTYYGYNDRGQRTRVWGDVPYPTETEYDDVYGRRVALSTFRGGAGWTGGTWPQSPGTADVTRWTYHDATGLLNSKTYGYGTALAGTVTYTYTVDGRLDERTWARGVTTAYGYDANSPTDLTSVTYTDPNVPTTALGFQYDRLGRRKQVTDAAGTRTIAYDPDDLQLTTETFTSGMFSGRRVGRLYEDGDNDTVAGRFRQLWSGTSADPNAADYAATYGYDDYGRLEHVTGPGLPSGDGAANGAFYQYLPGNPPPSTAQTDLVKDTFIRNSAGDPLLTVARGFDAGRDLVTEVDNQWGSGSPPPTLSSYGYAYDAADRREHNQRDGVAFGNNPFYEVYGYNGRGELTASAYHTGTYDTGTPDPNDSFAYTYDAIGNRASYTAGTLPTATYTSNALNQYTRTNLPTSPPLIQSYEYDADGNLTNLWLAGDMNCDGAVNTADVNAFTTAVQSCTLYAQTYPNCNCLNADINGDGVVSVADITPFIALLSGGNGALSQTYVWDAENRLVEYRPTFPTAGSQKVTFQYDYLGRRIEKAVYNWGGTDWEASAAYAIQYVYDGWRLLVEINQVGTVFRKYTWGLDVAGQMNGTAHLPGGLEAAGGIGGLLAVEQPVMAEDPYRRAYLYDANGNVTQVVNLAADPNDPNTAIVAKYEYDPHGNNLLDPNDPNASGTFAHANPFRFSTKYFDVETGLSYFGGRYYHAALGRWLNRDPIGELGGANLYAYAGNDPIDRIDPLGHAACVRGWHGCPGGDRDDSDGGGRCPKKGQPQSAQGDFVGPPDPQPSQPEPPPDDPWFYCWWTCTHGGAKGYSSIDACIVDCVIKYFPPDPGPLPPPRPLAGRVKPVVCVAVAGTALNPVVGDECAVSIVGGIALVCCMIIDAVSPPPPPPPRQLCTLVGESEPLGPWRVVPPFRNCNYRCPDGFEFYVTRPRSEPCPAGMFR